MDPVSAEVTKEGIATAKEFLFRLLAQLLKKLASFFRIKLSFIDSGTS
jgi:hypothetical protein